MKKTLVMLALGCCTAVMADDNVGNVAYQDSQVRFTVITDGVIRMEYAADGKFTDDESFIASVRKYPKTQYKLSDSKRQVTVKTDKMILTYQKGTGAFTAKNLSIVSAPKFPTKFAWHPGDKQKHNLGGTYRTLDGYDGDKYYAWGRLGDGSALPLEDGLLARDGWTVIDDSKGLLFDGDVNDCSQPELPWVKERYKGPTPALPSREGDREATSTLSSRDGGQDLYFMAYGNDYRQALKDYTVFAGRIPLPPRYVFGYWWSRYWSYSDAEMRKVVSDFERYGLPLDVLVVDMDWHWTEEGKGGWTGYTWNDRLFPSPEKFLQYLKSKNLQITVNLHPADGVPAYEDKYPALAEFLGRDPKSKETIKWASSDKRFVRGWLDKMIQPLTDQGVDFMWLDWQQALQDDAIPSLSNTWWLNYCVFDNQRRPSSAGVMPTKRPMLYHRWGGMGNHRYQIGFSGDTYSTWASLEYQPYFNHTSSNVCYGYWSHDLGGHMFVNDGDLLDPELYTRWMQLGTYLPVMRSHSTKNAAMEKEPWLLGKAYQPIVSQTIIDRYILAPYIYTAARQAYDTGISLCRPLYYAYPCADEAYAAEYRNEYMFGDDMLVAPITSPAVDGVSTVKVWLPEGEWYEQATGQMLKGGKVYERRFLLDEYPVYVRAGAVIPNYGKVKNLASNDERVTIVAYPSSASITSKGCFYEDNGNDQSYATNYATTELTHQSDAATETIIISKRNGSYDGMPAKRAYTVKVLNAAIPESVTVDGKSVKADYIADELAVSIDLGEIDPSVEHTIVINTPSLEGRAGMGSGLVGKMRRMRNTMTALKFRDAGINYIEGLGEMGSLAEAIGYFPEQFAERVASFLQSYDNLPEMLDRQGLKSADKEWFLHNVLYK